MPQIAIQDRTINIDQSALKYTVAGAMQAVIDTLTAAEAAGVTVTTREAAYNVHRATAGRNAYGWGTWEQAWADLRRVGFRTFAYRADDLRFQHTITTFRRP